MDLTFNDVGKKVFSNSQRTCYIGCFSVVGLILFILFIPCTITQLGQKKLALAKNTVTGVRVWPTIGVLSGCTSDPRLRQSTAHNASRQHMGLPMAEQDRTEPGDPSRRNYA